MTHQRFLTVIESGPESFGAFALDIPGCIAFSASKEEIEPLFKAAAESHLQQLAEEGEKIPIASTTEIPGLTVGIPSGAITLKWTEIEFQDVEPAKVEV